MEPGQGQRAQIMRLPAGIASRLVPNVNGLSMHILEAGSPNAPLLLLLPPPQADSRAALNIAAVAAHVLNLIAPLQKN